MHIYLIYLYTSNIKRTNINVAKITKQLFVKLPLNSIDPQQLFLVILTIDKIANHKNIFFFVKKSELGNILDVVIWKILNKYYSEFATAILSMQIKKSVNSEYSMKDHVLE